MTLPKAVKKILRQDWMSAPETGAVMNALENGRNSVAALFVGGCVRNALLGEAVEDVDIATVLKPEEVTEKLEKAGIRVVPTGVDHGTVTAVTEGRNFEITTLRRDVETDGRRAVVAYSDDWIEDARRRDFTMNTLLADREGNIFDPLGEGLKDLDMRKIRFVGEPEERIAEDYLRILRLFRFHALYGKGEPDSAALKACRAGAKKIGTLSRERVTQEFFKILMVENPVDILGMMFENSVLTELQFDVFAPRLMESVCFFQERYGLRALAPRLLVLVGLEPENIDAIKKILLIPKVFLKDMELIFAVLRLSSLDSDQNVKAAVYAYGRTATAQALMIELAQDRVKNEFGSKALDIVQNWDIPQFPLNGRDIMEASGVKAGPELGKLLAAAEQRWIENGFSPMDKAGCLGLV